MDGGGGGGGGGRCGGAGAVEAGSIGRWGRAKSTFLLPLMLVGCC